MEDDNSIHAIDLMVDMLVSVRHCIKNNKLVGAKNTWNDFKHLYEKQLHEHVDEYLKEV